MGREFQQRIVIEDADHDGIDVTRQHPRGVGNGLAAAELHFGARQHDRFTAELTHADVERHPGAGRGFFEDHRQGLAFERFFHLPMRLQLRLHGNAGAEHVAQLPDRQLAEIEKMAHGFTHCTAARCV